MQTTDAPDTSLPWITALATVQRLGGRVWAEDGALRVQVPRPLPAAVQASLRTHKAAVLDWLERCAARDAITAAEEAS